YEQHHQANAEADQRRSDSCPNASVDVIAVRNFCDALDRDGIIPFPLDQQNLVSHKLDSQLVVLIEINAAAFILHAVGDGSLCSVSANWQGYQNRGKRHSQTSPQKAHDSILMPSR